MSSTPGASQSAPVLHRQEPADNWLMEWLKLNNLQHLYSKIDKQHIEIEELAECDQETIKEIAMNRLNLTGKELKKFILSVQKYSNLGSLTKRNDEITKCIENLEFTKNELDIKKTNDIVYIKEKFKKIMKRIKQRENIIINEFSAKMENKKNLLNEQILNLNEYKIKLTETHNKLQDNKSINDDNLNLNINVLLNERLNFNKNMFKNINKISVELPNYDILMSDIKKTGIINDSFDLNDNDGNDDDDKLKCLCGTNLVLSNVSIEYPSTKNNNIYCYFCNIKCTVPDNGDLYHCPNGDIKLHPGGFDLCYFCGSRCFEARTLDKRRKKEEKKQRRLFKKHQNELMKKLKDGKDNKNKQNEKSHKKQSSPPRFDQIRHHRSYSAMKSSQYAQTIHARQNSRYFAQNFMYPSQLKQLLKMGYDHSRAKKLIIKHKGNMTKVMQELIT